MKTTLTQLEYDLLTEIISCEDEDCNICFDRQLSPSEKGVMSSLVKKDLVYDAFENEGSVARIGEGYDKHNYFPTEKAYKAVK
jgi:hypothetical protein